MLPSGRLVGAEAALQVEQSTGPTVPNLGTTMRVSVASVGSQEISTSLFPSISIGGRSADKANNFKWFLETSGTKEDLYGIHFVNRKIGWIVGNGGTILFTYNGGVNWSPQTSGVSVDLRGVYFSDSLIGWIVGSSGTILHTIDGGETWISQDSSTFDNLYALDFVDNKHGWVVGDNSTILYTNNGGVTWNPQKPPEGFMFFYS